MPTRRFSTLLLIAGLFAVPLGAQSPTMIDVEPLACVPEHDKKTCEGDNAVVHATIAPEVGGTLTELYFRWKEDEDFYYVRMVAEGNGRYWGVMPKPESDNEMVEYYLAVVDPLGQVLAKTEAMTAPVEGDCEVELSEQQRGVAENLTVGETTAEQRGLAVERFRCCGVVTRIGHDGVVRGDEFCRACVIAWHEKPGILIPAGAGIVAGGILISQDRPPEASPTTP